MDLCCSFLTGMILLEGGGYGYWDVKGRKDADYYLAVQSMLCVGIVVEEETVQGDSLLLSILLDVDYQDNRIEDELASCRIAVVQRRSIK